MKKIVSLITVLILVLCFGGCAAQSSDSSDTTTQIVVLPSEETAKNVNGYKNPSTQSSSDNETSSFVSSETDISSAPPEISYYVGNKNSKKFHTQYCKYVSSISDKNLHSFKTADEALEQGYSPCGYCMKE